MKARMLSLLLSLGIALPGLLGLAGCRSWDRSGGGGCGSGCCRGAGPESEPAADLKPCPVSGEKLGSMGEPVPVAIGGRTVLVCCEGCVEQLKRDPGRYLGKEAAPGQGASQGGGRP